VRTVLGALLHDNEIQTFTILDQYVEKFNLLKAQINLKECFLYIWKHF